MKNNCGWTIASNSKKNGRKNNFYIIDGFKPKYKDQNSHDTVCNVLSKSAQDQSTSLSCDGPDSSRLTHDEEKITQATSTNIKRKIRRAANSKRYKTKLREEKARAAMILPKSNKLSIITYNENELCNKPINSTLPVVTHHHHSHELESRDQVLNRDCSKIRSFDPSVDVKKFNTPISFSLFEALNNNRYHISAVSAEHGKKDGAGTEAGKVRKHLPEITPTKTGSGVIRRKKEREIPRVKRNSRLKREILRVRQLKKESLTITETDLLEGKADETTSSIQQPVVTNHESYSIQEDDCGLLCSQMSQMKCDVSTPEKHAAFSGYHDHVLDDSLNAYVMALLQDMVRFQDRLFERDSLKAVSKRRYVVGLRQAKKYLQVKKVCLLIFASNMESVEELALRIEELKRMAKEFSVPYLFSLTRKRLAAAVKRKTSVGCIAILNYQGSEVNVTGIREMLPVLRSKFMETLHCL